LYAGITTTVRVDIGGGSLRRSAGIGALA